LRLARKEGGRITGNPSCMTTPIKV
jgi:hypothetical protein